MHKFFRGDDAGPSPDQPRNTFDMRLPLANFVSPDQPQPFHAVILTALLKGGEFSFPVSIGSHHQFSAMAKRDAVFLAEFVGEAIALDAEPCLQRIFRVVDSGVVHAAVARARSHAQFWKLLDKKNVLPALGNSARDRAADDATADD